MTPKKYLFLSLLLGLVTFLCPVSSSAKWWIFGQSEEAVSIDYLYFNQQDAGEVGDELTFYSEFLRNGEVTLRGKARVRDGKIGSVRVTLDDKTTWRPAKLSSDGAFEFVFKPSLAQPITLFVEVMDTRGKTNDIEATRKVIRLSDRAVRGMITDALDALVASYSQERAVPFMAWVSGDFAGDALFLEDAVRKDFSLFENIDLRYTLNSLSSGSQGHLYASITYNRRVMSARTGETYTDRGSTEFTFVLGDARPRVYSMKTPLIFGLSDAENVATGVVVQGGNTPILVVDPHGGMKLLPFYEARDVVEGGDAESTTETGANILLNVQGHPPVGFSFEDGEATLASGDFVLTGVPTPSTGYGFLEPGVTMKDLGPSSLVTLQEAPETGYTAPMSLTLAQGNTYAFHLANGRYGALSVRSVSHTDPGLGQGVVRIDYVYQPDGSRSFK